jgi:hypothetical protein
MFTQHSHVLSVYNQRPTGYVVKFIRILETTCNMARIVFVFIHTDTRANPLHAILRVSFPSSFFPTLTNRPEI